MTSQAETFCRNRRLFDVRRGVVYLRRTDNLAQHQWRHYGTVPAIKTHVIRDIGVTTRLSAVNASQYISADQSLEETRELESDVRVSKNDVRNSVSDVVNVKQPAENKTLVHRTQMVENFSNYPQISVTEVEDLNPNPMNPPAGYMTSSLKLHSPEYLSHSADLPPQAASSISSFSFPQGDLSLLSRSDGVKDVTMTSSLPAFRQPTSTSKHDQHSFRETRSFPGLPPEGAHFDTWGSRDWMKWEADVTPRSYAPRRYPLMSRVVGGGVGGREGGGGPRQLKTLTDFRSGNGTIRVIRPLQPPAGAMRAPVVRVDEADEDLDLQGLEREQTYAMLKRIDRLLEPSKAYFFCDITCSQREVSLFSPSHSTSSDITESLPGSREERKVKDQSHVHQNNFQNFFSLGDGPCGNGIGLVKGMSSERDPHQEYYDRIQGRLAHFYGQSGPQDPSRMTPRRGHSEYPRQIAGSFNERSSDVSHGQHPQDGGDRSRSGHDVQEAFPPNPRPSAARSRPLPPLKKVGSGSKATLDDPRIKQCGHFRNVRASAGVKREDGKGLGVGGRGSGWGTLGEVVKNLEEKVDLHLKCQDWIRASFT
ncbi:hypothetical protein ACOMHN_021225 [Nucella lapillus]